jgi:nucleotide-binding universal stress UspA family protein
VVVRPIVRKGDPITELLELSADAAMVIVGSRGRGGFKGSVLGSTGQALIAHADAPVVVVRPLD